MMGKFDLKKLAKFRRIHLNSAPPHESSLEFTYPVDWVEFNQMFFTKKNVLIEYPQGSEYNMLFLMGFYAGLKMARNVHIGMCNYGDRCGFPHCCEFAMRVGCRDVGDNVLFSYEPTPFQTYKNRVLECDEWVMNADIPPYPSTPPRTSDAAIIYDWILKTNGLVDLGVDYDEIVPKWLGMSQSRRKKFIDNLGHKKFIVAWDERGRKRMDEVLEKFPDEFVAIRYTKEKRLVDEWFSRNETMVDPAFDIHLLEPGISPRKVLLYAATNHLYDFRNFARVLPDVVKEFMSPKELKELL